MAQKLTDDEYEARLAKGYDVGSIKELMETQTFKDAFASAKGDVANALRAVEVKKESWPKIRGWFVAAIPDWNFKQKALTGKTTIVLLTEQGDVVEKQVTTKVDTTWSPLKTTLEIGPVSRSTYLLKDEADPKRVLLNYKEAQIRAAAHDAPIPDHASPGAAEAIKRAVELKTKGKRITMRLKIDGVVLRGTITDDPTQINYKEGGDYEEALQVVIKGSDGAVVQTNFKGNAIYSPDWVAQTFGIDKEQDSFREALLNQPVFARGQLGTTMPYEPAKGDDAIPEQEIERWVGALRDNGFFKKETYDSHGQQITRERLDLKGKKDDQGKPVKSVLFCGREVVDIEEDEDENGNQVWKASVLMTDQAGKYPWFACNPGKPRQGSEQPPNNVGAFFIFLEKMEGTEIKRDDSASANAARWAQYAPKL